MAGPPLLPLVWIPLDLQHLWVILPLAVFTMRMSYVILVPITLAMGVGCASSHTAKAPATVSSPLAPVVALPSTAQQELAVVTALVLELVHLSLPFPV